MKYKTRFEIKNQQNICCSSAVASFGAKYIFNESEFISRFFLQFFFINCAYPNVDASNISRLMNKACHVLCTDSDRHDCLVMRIQNKFILLSLCFFFLRIIRLLITSPVNFFNPSSSIILNVYLFSHYKYRIDRWRVKEKLVFFLGECGEREKKTVHKYKKIFSDQQAFQVWNNKKREITWSRKERQRERREKNTQNCCRWYNMWIHLYRISINLDASDYSSLFFFFKSQIHCNCCCLAFIPMALPDIGQLFPFWFIYVVAINRNLSSFFCLLYFYFIFGTLALSGNLGIFFSLAYSLSLFGLQFS